MLSRGEDSSLWAEYGMQPAALLQGAGTSGRGDRIIRPSASPLRGPPCGRVRLHGPFLYWSG